MMMFDFDIKFKNTKINPFEILKMHNYVAPWNDDMTDEQLSALDFAFNKKYGERLTTPFTDGLLNEIHEIDTELGAGLFTHYISARYNDRWTRLYELTKIKYNPIENYRMEEIGKDISAQTHQQTGSATDSGTDTDTYKNIKDQKSGSLSRSGSVKTKEASYTEETQVSADDASEYVASQKIIRTPGSSDGSTTYDGYTETDGRANTRSGSIEKTYGKSTATSENGSNNGQVDHTLTRSGNIGVTTSQQMAQSEIELWQWMFFDEVFEDLKNLLTIDIY